VPAVLRDAKPRDVVDFGRIRRLPQVLAGLFGVMAAATLAHLLATSIRRRRPELAILKTIGGVRRQVRIVVAVQALTVAAVALAIGLPLGIAAGRWAWHEFAVGLGIVPEPRVPWIALGSTTVAALVVALLVSAIPGALAARARPSEVLRAE
jgi:putative ABC transport system permease protein